MAVSTGEISEKFSIFSYGFRPFFLAAGGYAILPILPWLLYLLDIIEPNIPLHVWHAHEMIFGFVGAGIAGFLLSALPNWTNTPPIAGNDLKVLLGLWLAGRFAFWLFLFFDHPLFGYLLFIDMILPVVQFIHVSQVLLSTKNNRNYIFIGILLAFALANFLALLDINNVGLTPASSGVILATNIIMITLSVIGGRVIPSFTRTYLKQKNSSKKIAKLPFIEKPALILLVLIALLDLILPHSALSYGIALITGLVHLVRFSQWGGFETRDNPIVWVLHVAYFMMIVALFLKGGEGVFDFPFHLYLHCFTVGSIGLFMIAIMSRASLGHTGRPLRVEGRITCAYISLLIAALVRVVAPFFPSFLSIGLLISIGFWVVAYLLFLNVYIPILIRPRVDGQPG